MFKKYFILKHLADKFSHKFSKLFKIKHKKCDCIENETETKITCKKLSTETADFLQLRNFHQEFIYRNETKYLRTFNFARCLFQLAEKFSQRKRFCLTIPYKIKKPYNFAYFLLRRFGFKK